MSKITIYIVCILSFFGLVDAKADHIIGGEFSYVCLGNGEYEFFLKIYRDCYSSGADFDQPAAIGVFTQDNQFYNTYNKFPTSIQAIEPDFGADCITYPPDICVEEGIYNFTLTLPENGVGYKVVYQRCCRNPTILNLNDPGSQGLTIVADVPPESIAECNSSPSYNDFPPVVICAQQELVFDHSATDPDGDSLVYELCSPFLGATENSPAPNPPSTPPYNFVNWGAGFTETDPIPGNPGLSIDPVTGLLTGTPTQLGQFVVGVCVSEYRDGVLLSTNRRDFQFNITTCIFETEAVIAEVDPADLCEGLTINFGNDSDLSNTFLWDFGVEGTNNDQSTIIAPSYTFPDTGTYIVTLVTNPGMVCSDTSTVELPLYYMTSVQFGQPDFVCIDDEQYFSFNATGQFTDEYEVSWDFGPNANPPDATGINPQNIVFSETGEQEVTVNVVNGGCSGTYTDDILVPEPIIPVIDPQEDFCVGLTMGFTQSSINSSSYSWDFGVNSSEEDVSQSPNPFFTFPEVGEYTVSLTAYSPIRCPATITESFEINPLLEAFFVSPPVECFDENEMNFTAAGSTSPNTNYSWEFDGGIPATSQSQNPSGISFEAPGNFEVSLTVEDYGCTDEYVSEVEVHPNPVALFDAREYEGCVPFETKFLNTSISSSDEVSYEWDFGDGNYGYSKSPVHTYNYPGLFSVSLTITNEDGCMGSDTQTINNFINVNPKPKAGFSIDPGVVSIVEPIVTITDLSEGAVFCRVTFGDEVVENICTFTYELENPESMEIVQYVENEFGCWSETSATLRVSDHLIYIPNSFTPDNDGINDMFIPVTYGVITMDMKIFDRWGKQIFRSTEMGEGWRGESYNNDDYYLGTGVYQYVIDVTDNLGWNHIYTGSIQLIR